MDIVAAAIRFQITSEKDDRNDGTTGSELRLNPKEKEKYNAKTKGTSHEGC
jgi:hypothetical protein